MSSMSIAFKLALAACVFLTGPTLQGEAGPSLRASGTQTEMGFLSAESVEKSFIAELRAAVGHSASHDRLSRLEAELRPMYVALPKNAHGNLEHAVVRYALHRYFVQKHGWSVRGLEPDGEAGTASSPAAAMKDHVPSYIQGLFEQRLGELGFSTRELAIFAATLEDVVHSGVIERLQAVYSMMGLPTSSVERTDSALIFEAVNLYMMSYIIGKNVSEMQALSASTLKRMAKATYPAWGDTEMWLHDVQRSVEFAEMGRSNPFRPKSSGKYDFGFAAHIVETVEDKYGSWQNLECHNLKGKLLSIEDRETGRVSLSNFYKHSSSEHLFTEGVDYLRDLGALDESDRTRPFIVIPNYLTSPANCLATSGLYSVCCLNECEGLMMHLEREIGAPTADAQRIMELVSGLPSDTVDAPRNISGLLRNRLEHIASSHNGEVPLHGRLFAQWMHHAYPHECPYPHLSGTTSPRTADEWMAKNGMNSDAADEEMQRHVSDGRDAPEAIAEALPWTAEEELLVARKSTMPLIRNLALLVAVVSFAMTLRLAIGTGGSVSAKSDALPFFKSHYV